MKVDSVPASVDRAEFNGYASYITSHSKYKLGVYSSRQRLDVDLRDRLGLADTEHV